MDTVLMGPDGRPAIDAATSMPLTMEEMLRRRGIVAMGNNVSMMGPSGPTAASPSATTAANSTSSTSANGPTTAAAAAMAARAGGGSPIPNDGDGPDAETPQDNAQEAAAALDSAGLDPAVVQTLEGLGVLAAGTGAAYLAYKTLKSRGGGAPGANPTTGLQAVYNTAPEDAQFRELDKNKLSGPKAAKVLEGRAEQRKLSGSKGSTRVGNTGTKALPAPQKQLPGPSGSGRMAAAEAVAARAARGQPNDVGTIHAPAPAKEGPIPEAVLNLLKRLVVRK